MYGKKTYSFITMMITKPAWSRTVSMKVWSIEPEFSMVYITEPARDKGSVTLKRKNEVWNWLPTVQKTIKIPPSMMLASWMGSDFTNDDLVRQSSIVEDYSHTLLGEELYGGYECYKIELVPKPEAGVVWGMIITWISKKGYMQLKEEFYDEEGVLVRTMLGSKPKNFDGHLLPSYSEMIPHNKPGNRTTFETKELDFDVNISPEFFSIQNMSRVK
ncbi:MAG TPA: outer membrane lipoprotein-sorting protein [Bacteroidetes bacterium]|nr:outer membrane lipoprotein-sorting protein [Bacteroidota bacterium]